LCPDRLTGHPETLVCFHPFRCQGHGPGTGIAGVFFAFDQKPFLQQDEHGPHRGGVGRHTLGQFSLSEHLTPGEGRQKDKLIGRNPEFGKLQIRPTMHCQVCGSKGNRNVASGRHRKI
jgi:hypothetical protein